jgi:nucleoside triphosphate diphosphatase
MTGPVSDDVARLQRLVDVMARLRDPIAGCPWDRDQTFGTIAPYTIEEAYEVQDAIARNDMAALVDELGDLQLQIVFHARIAEDAGLFDLGDVLEAITAKMIRRHPHIFSEASTPADWESLKAAERGAGSALDGVALGLPALMRAAKIQKRAARVGFDWPDGSGPRAKIDEELAEADEASGEAASDEIGDLLFSVVNWARHRGVDPEAALRQATAKFERRFRLVEAAAPLPGPLTLEALDVLWRQAKQAERAGRSARQDPVAD